MTKSEKLVITGLYLSKFDLVGLRRLGFDSFVEAFNVIGFALDAKPASIKNYRDEFDPINPNARMGWHKRSMKPYCQDIYLLYKDLNFDHFTALVQSFFIVNRIEEDEPDRQDESDTNSSFAQRLLTGLAAEHYFESVWSEIPEFQDRTLENTTRLGCGYDFKLSLPSISSDYFAVEVKGLMESNGTISLTPKEHRLASTLSDRFFVFIARNFREKPNHLLFQNPLSSNLDFAMREIVRVERSWIARV